MNELKELEKQLQEQQDKVNSLQLEIVRLKNIEQGNQWTPSEGDRTYYVTDSGKVFNEDWNNNQLENDRLSIGNIFKTEEEAKFEVERLKVTNELKKYSSEFVLGTDNYSIVFIHIGYVHGFVCPTKSTNMQHNTLYFSSEEIANKAIEKVGKERIIKYYLGVN